MAVRKAKRAKGAGFSLSGPGLVRVFQKGPASLSMCTFCCLHQWDCQTVPAKQGVIRRHEENPGPLFIFVRCRSGLGVFGVWCAAKGVCAWRGQRICLSRGTSGLTALDSVVLIFGSPKRKRFEGTSSTIYGLRASERSPFAGTHMGSPNSGVVCLPCVYCIFCARPLLKRAGGEAV